MPCIHLAIDRAWHAHALAKVHKRGAIKATVLCLLRNVARATLLARTTRCGAWLPSSPIRHLAVCGRWRGSRLLDTILRVAILALNQFRAPVALEGRLYGHNAATFTNAAAA